MPDRQTFAFTAGQPAQSRSTLDGQSGGAAVQGGNNTGGVERASPMTFANPNDVGELPEFLQNAMEPYIRQKQQEAVTKAVDDYAGGKAYDQMVKSDSGWSKVFGPSLYHQAAAMYNANTSVDSISDKLLNDDDIYKLSPTDMSAEVSRQYQTAFTGDPTADGMIGQKMLEARLSVMNTLSKKQYAFGQQQTIKSASGSADTAAGVYQSTMAAQSSLSAPTDADLSAQTQAQSNFLSAFIKPHGMDDAS